MKCHYCERTYTNGPMFVIRKAVKPAGYRDRHIDVGRCCESCEAEGKPIYIPFKPVVSSKTVDIDTSGQFALAG